MITTTCTNARCNACFSLLHVCVSCYTYVRACTAHVRTCVHYHYLISICMHNGVLPSIIGTSSPTVKLTLKVTHVPYCADSDKLKVLELPIINRDFAVLKYVLLWTWAGRLRQCHDLLFRLTVLPALSTVQTRMTHHMCITIFKVHSVTCGCMMAYILRRTLCS